MALETRAYEFRTYLACMAQGIAPGEALSGNLLKLPNGPMLREGSRTSSGARSKRQWSSA
jgi:hypothetical protein